jgi:molybdenum cofactor cytidylyltransferase
MHQGRIVAVVLAAGGSTRLGQPKQLLKLGETPLLEYVLRTVRRARVDDRYIVLGYGADAIREAISLDGFHEIHNRDYISGQSTSICAAVDAVATDTAAIIFVLGDQPLQVPGVIDLIVESYRQEPAPIIQPQYREGPGNPVLIDHTLFGELAQLTGDTGARPILRENPNLIRRVDCASWERPGDVDTWEDYDRVKAAYEAMTEDDDQ